MGCEGVAVCCDCDCDVREGFVAAEFEGVSFFRKSRSEGSKSRRGSFVELSSVELHNQPIVAFVVDITIQNLSNALESKLSGTKCRGVSL